MLSIKIPVVKFENLFRQSILLHRTRIVYDSIMIVVAQVINVAHGPFV